MFGKENRVAHMVFETRPRSAPNEGGGQSDPLRRFFKKDHPRRVDRYLDYFGGPPPRADRTVGDGTIPPRKSAELAQQVFEKIRRDLLVLEAVAHVATLADRVGAVRSEPRRRGQLGEPAMPRMLVK